MGGRHGLEVRGAGAWPRAAELLVLRQRPASSTADRGLDLNFVSLSAANQVFPYVS